MSDESARPVACRAEAVVEVNRGDPDTRAGVPADGDSTVTVSSQLTRRNTARPSTQLGTGIPAAVDFRLGACSARLDRDWGAVVAWLVKSVMNRRAQWHRF